MIYKKTKFPSELRFDLISKDWVVIATGRAKRPETFKIKGRKEEGGPKSQCPFCDLRKQEIPTLVFSQGKKIPFKPGDKIPGDWTTIVVPNKYPAFIPSENLDSCFEGNFYQKMKAVGFHEVIITRDHKKQLAQFSVKEVKEVIDVYQTRYWELMGKKFVNHISIFHNHGQEAGASIAHPHSQIITTPLVDVDLKKALLNTQEYQKKHRRCAYCQMNDWERKVKKRIVFENQEFLVICPFASKTAFEVIITPQKHLSYFERITEKEKWQLAEALRIALFAVYKALNNPAYNFYLHSAPCDKRISHNYYHWHFTVLPKTNIPAGFEMGSRMEVSVIEPEKAAEYLKKQIK